MKMKFLFISIILSVIIVVIVLSCQKNESDTVNISESDLTSGVTAALANVTTTSSTIASSEDIQSVSVTDFDSIFHSLGKLSFPINKMKLNLKHLSDCATVTVSDTVYPQTITIDYGDGCTEHHHQKSGKIIIVISDSAQVAGSVTTVTYEDFYCDSNKIEFSGTLKNLGKDTSGNWVVQTAYSEKITTASGNVVVEDFNNKITWTSGFLTAKKSDDVYSKTGSGSITINDTLAYSCTITKALVYDYSCGNIISGAIDLYKKGTTVTINYGDGTCDETATVTINGTSEDLDIASISFTSGGNFDKHSSHKNGKHKF